MNKSNKLNIYLGDLDHFALGNRISVPYSVASIKSYCVEKFKRDVNIKLFKNPEKLMKNVLDNPPHIVGLSYYMWNEKLTQYVAECCKKIDPNIVTVLGGPSIARGTDLYKDLLINSDFDVIVLDQGEKSFANVVERILSNGCDKNNFLNRAIGGCGIQSSDSNEILRGESITYRGFEGITSPYLNGYLDEFLEDGLMATFETVRGCPYRCTFCGAGDIFYSKIYIREEEIVYEELEYIRERCHRKEIDLIDTNWGILKERDLRITKHMLKMYRETGFPRITGFAITKQQTPETLEIQKGIAEMSGHMTFGLQTLTESVLKKSKRQNISTKMMRELSEFARMQNLPIVVDSIFGLPGETYSSFMNSLQELNKIGIKEPDLYQTRLLVDSELAQKQRDEYGYVGKFRPLANRMEVYKFLPKEKQRRIVELEEVAISSNDFSFEDYMKVREYGMLVTLFLGLGTYRDSVHYLSTRNITITDLICEVQANRDINPELKGFFEEYRNFAEGELLTEDPSEIHKKISNDKYWNQLSSNGGRFFKINFGFAGYCIFENLNVLKTIEEIVERYVCKRLNKIDQEEYKEILKYDKSLWLIQKYDCKRLDPNEVVLELNVNEDYNYIGWKEGNYTNPLKQYRLNNICRRVNKATHLDSLNYWTNELAELGTYTFYERLVLYMPPGFSRRQNIPPPSEYRSGC